MILECYSQDAYDKYTKNDASATLKNTGGVYGGGSETLIVQNIDSPLLNAKGGGRYIV